MHQQTSFLTKKFTKHHMLMSVTYIFKKGFNVLKQGLFLIFIMYPNFWGEMEIKSA